MFALHAEQFPDAFPRTFSLRFLGIEQQGLLPVGRRINPWYRAPGALAPSHLRSPVWSADWGTKRPAKCHGAGPIARLSYTDNFSSGRPARRLQESCPSTTFLHWGKFPLGFAPWLPDPPGWSSTWACGRPLGSKIACNGRSSSESARRSASDKQERIKSVQALKNHRKESRSRAGPRRNAPPELVQSASAASGIQDQEHFGRAGREVTKE